MSTTTDDCRRPATDGYRIPLRGGLQDDYQGSTRPDDTKTRHFEDSMIWRLDEHHKAALIDDETRTRATATDRTQRPDNETRRDC